MTCEGCGIEFKRGRRDQRYHNRACKINAAGRRRRARQPKPRIKCAARGCRRDFVRPPRTRKKYCGKPCRVREVKRLERARQPKFERRPYCASLRCDRRFEAKNGRHVYCSRRCCEWSSKRTHRSMVAMRRKPGAAA